MAIKKILVVEDDAGTRKLLEHRLKSAGYEVKLTADGQQVVSLAKDFSANLILMDIILPGIDGAEAIQLIKKDYRTAHIPVIFISAMLAEKDFGNPEVVVGGVVYPAIPKPINFDHLLQAIEQFSDAGS